MREEQCRARQSVVPWVDLMAHPMAGLMVYLWVVRRVDHLVVQSAAHWALLWVDQWVDRSAHPMAGLWVAQWVDPKVPLSVGRWAVPKAHPLVVRSVPTGDCCG